MSNVIKLRRVAHRVRIEHTLEDIHRFTVERNPAATEEPVGRQEAVQEDAYVPMVDEYQRGLDAGRAEAEARLRALYDQRVAEERAAITRLMSGIRQEFLRVHNTWEQSVLKLAVTIAHAIVKREVSIDREVILGQVRESLRHLIGVERVKLRVNPRDEEILREHRTALFSSSDSLRDMVIEADDKIEQGGCIVESESGNVDARLSSQMNKVETMVFEQNQQEAAS